MQGREYRGAARLSRREFLRAAVRHSVLGVLSLVGGYLVVRGRAVRGQQCVGAGVCSRCALFTDCRLPAALSAQCEGGVATDE